MWPSPVKALALGARDRRFESCHPDNIMAFLTKLINDNQKIDNEQEWMAAHIYNGDFQGRIDEIALTDKHKF